MNHNVVAAVFLLLLFSILGESSKFRFAVAQGGTNWDFGKGFHVNIARINLQAHLTANYPNVETDHVFAVIPEDFLVQCNAQFLTWLNSGVNLIIGMLGHQPCFLNIAKSWPNVTFAVVLGTASGPSNYVNLQARVYEALYLAGYTAGMATKVKKVCISANVRQPSPVMFIFAFSLGVHYADPSVEIHIMETGVMEYPLLEVWNVNQSYALGCDVVYVQSVAIDGCKQAQVLQLMSVGLFSDARLTVGEYVITSAVVDFTPMFIRVADAVLNGTLQNETKKSDWWMGWEWGAMSVPAPSFLVPINVTAKVQALQANVSRVFCGRVCTTTGCLCTNSSCCVSDQQLNKMVSFPDFVTEHGLTQLPGKACKAGQLATWHLDNFTMVCSNCPAGTYAYNVDQISECRSCPAATYSSVGSTNCTACPAGTYNDQLGRGQCIPCPAGAIAANPGASKCNVCPSGISNSDNTECGSESLIWLAGLGGGIGALLLLVGLWAWWASSKMRKLQKQFSNDNVAVECAAAIARLDLQAVAWLNDIPKPNCIQLSFIRIVQILEQVRKYVPDQLLQSLACGKDEASNMENAAEEVQEVKSLYPSSSAASKSSMNRIQPLTSAHVSGSRLSTNTTLSLNSQSHQGLLAVRKVTYLLVQFNMNQHQSTISHAEGNLKAFLSHLVETSKAQRGTLGSVTYDRAVIHWGTGRRDIAEASKYAVETALALAGFTAKLQGDTQLHLNIAIGCGNTITGVVETATNSFFVVGGGQVPLVEKIIAKDWESTLGLRILITDAVRGSVQYNYLCHPRLVEVDDLLWEPIALKNERMDDEWMYQLQEGEETVTLTPAVLLGPFRLLRKGEYAQAEVLAREIEAKHGKDLQCNDRAALNWVKSKARACLSTPTCAPCDGDDLHGHEHTL
eukprot:GGOE01030940.1.p1 GENE.GGOE01030940.1~~GGOE01030940.1.p1  ORF type:complete len:906 (-),score=257.32 GGOE01030940.1:607-3324(-)